MLGLKFSHLSKMSPCQESTMSNDKFYTREGLIVCVNRIPSGNVKQIAVAINCYQSYFSYILAGRKIVTGIIVTIATINQPHIYDICIHRHTFSGLSGLYNIALSLCWP